MLAISSPLLWLSHLLSLLLHLCCLRILTVVCPIRMSSVGLRAEEDEQTVSGASGERPYGPSRGLGKRPSSKWSKLGSDAESPPGKRVKAQVPGVKAANGKVTPPGLCLCLPSHHYRIHRLAPDCPCLLQLACAIVNTSSRGGSCTDVRSHQAYQASGVKTDLLLLMSACLHCASRSITMMPCSPYELHGVHTAVCVLLYL